MFTWPRTIANNRRGTVPVTGRHWTDHCTKTMESCCQFTMFATGVGCGIIASWWYGQPIGSAIMIGFFAVIPGAFVALITYPFSSSPLRVHEQPS